LSVDASEEGQDLKGRRTDPTWALSAHVLVHPRNASARLGIEIVVRERHPSVRVMGRIVSASIAPEVELGDEGEVKEPTGTVFWVYGGPSRLDRFRRSS